MNTQKCLTFFLRILLVLSIVCQSAWAQKPSQEDARIARLVGLAKVWGTVKYFHPYLAYREIDWDRALIEAIPKVNEARTPADYQNTINQMLAVLNDKSTRADGEVSAQTVVPKATEPKLVRTENGALIIEAPRIAQAVAKDMTALNGFVTNINQAITSSSSVIIDARGTGKLTEIEAYHFENFMRQTLTSMLDTTVTLGSTRYRMHNGYATQTGGGASFYYSALVNSAPQTITGRSKTKTPPIAFIINEHSPSFAGVLSGLQSTGRAVVIQEGEPPAADTFTIDLPDNLKVRMRTSELINADGSIDLQPDTIVAKATIEDALRALKENRTPKRNTVPAVVKTVEIDKPYTEMVFPNVEYRLLALFRFWNVLNNFFPYKELIGDSWQTVLPRYIPKFEANKDAVDYQLTVRELVTEMCDSHGGLRNADAAAEKLGMFAPPVLSGHLEGKSVVTKVLDDKLPIKVGDIILSVDG
jgi:hypothetical protein